MELPLGGPALRHYTQSRPRPHRQKLNYRPSKPQETIIESENEVLEHMGRVDEGVEEFFTKRVLPSETLKSQDEESITVHEVAPASSVPSQPPTKTLRRKLGDFFTLKKRRGLKSEASHEGRPKKTSIADLIRPLREAARAEKEKDRVKEHDKENEKEKAREQPSGVTVETDVQETPVPGAPPLRAEAVPPRRALREGKSQSLILLSGSAAGTTNARNNSKKQFEGQHSFEQKLHLMLQRIGVSKPQPGETQSQEGEMKKAESEGTIIDSKPEPPPTFSKPRTMSASSDTRHQIRPSMSAHESAGKPALLPKPVLKPGPPPTASGRNTPENELTQIQEAETATPTKAPPAAPAPTVSSSAPDSAGFIVPSSSTVTPSDTEICTDSIKPTTADTTPTNVIELDDKAVPDAATTEPPSQAIPTTTSPTEAPTTTSVPSTSSEPITPSISVTSSSVTLPSTSTSETVSAPNDESSAATSANVQTESDLSEPNVIPSVDPVAAAGGEVAVLPTASSPTTTMSGALPGPSTATDSGPPTTAVTSDAAATEAAPPPSISSDIITASPDAPIAGSSTLPSTNTISSVCHLATTSPPDIPAPSTSSSETTPTDTTCTITSLTHADTTYITSSTTTAAISSTLMIESDPPHISNVSTELATAAVSSLPDIGNSSATSPHVTGPADSSDSIADGLQTSPEPSPGAPAEKTTAGEADMVQQSKPAEMDENKEATDDAKKREGENEKPAVVSDEGAKKEGQEEKGEEEEDTTATLLLGKEGEQGSDKGVTEGPQHKEDKSVNEK